MKKYTIYSILLYKLSLSGSIKSIAYSNHQNKNKNRKQASNKKQLTNTQTPKHNHTEAKPDR